MKTQINEIQEARASVRPTTHPTFVRFDPSADQAVKGRSTFDDTRSEDSRHSGAGIRAENFFHQTTQKVASPIGPALGYGPDPTVSPMSTGTSTWTSMRSPFRRPDFLLVAYYSG